VQGRVDNTVKLSGDNNCQWWWRIWLRHGCVIRSC